MAFDVRTEQHRILHRYEHEFASHVGATQAVSFWKGRVALSAILDAIGIGEADEVILPGFTCVVVPNAVTYLGAIPIYADIDARTLNLDVAALEGKLSSRTRAIIVQHSFGVPADLDAVLGLAQRVGVPVIEDCAHALGSRYKGRRVGSHGAAAFFSFQWSKPYSTGLGGMAVTNDATLATRLAEVQRRYAPPQARELAALRLQGLLYRRLLTPRAFWLAMDVLHGLSALRLFVGSSSSAELICNKPAGYEKRMSAFQASWGLRELAGLEQNLAHRKHIVQLYRRLLSQAGIDTLDVPPYADPVYVRFPLLVRDKEAVLRQARRAHVEIGSWFETTVHPHETPLAAAGYTPGTCPVGEEMARRIINLPVHRKVSEGEAVRVVEFLRSMRAQGWV